MTLYALGLNHQTAPLYIFLALWSIGFGYGFWWSLIAGEEATRNSMSALQEDARTATGSISRRNSALGGSPTTTLPSFFAAATVLSHSGCHGCCACKTLPHSITRIR